jgi:ATP-dependent Clp protease ATP-binding subunit ClpA
MTSNLGSHMIQQMAGDDYQVIKLAVMGEVKTYFRPEVINRIDEVGGSTRWMRRIFAQLRESSCNILNRGSQSSR